MPEAFPVARAEGQCAKAERAGIDLRAGGGNIGRKRFGGLFVAQMRGRIDAADAAPGGQADIPDPAGSVGGGNGLRGDGAGLLINRHLHGQRAIVEQHRASIDEVYAEMAAQQQRCMAGAIDEQVARNGAMRTSFDRRDIAVVGCGDAGDLVADMTHAEPGGGVAGEQGGKLAGIQMIAIVQGTRVGRHALLLGREAQIAYVLLRADSAGEGEVRLLQPGGDEVIRSDGGRRGEGVQIAV